MDLIEKLGKIDGRYKGTFKCPVCNNIVTRTVYDGIHNGTCGNQQCKSIFFPTTKITDIKYYRAFSEKFYIVKNLKTLHLWKKIYIKSIKIIILMESGLTYQMSK